MLLDVVLDTYRDRTLVLDVQQLLLDGVDVRRWVDSSYNG